MERKSLLIMTILMFMSVSIRSFAEGIEFETLSLSKGLEKAKKENKLVFIDVYATWCAPCKYLSKNVFTDPELGEFMNENFINLKIDGELDDGNQLMVDFELDAYPTMLFLTPEKKLIKKIVGAVSAEEIHAKANGIVFPESTELYKLSQEYQSGNRERDFLSKYIIELMLGDEDTAPLVDLFIANYPDINLENENEFMIFCLGIEKADHPLIQKFIQNIAYYHNAFPEQTETKLKMIILDLANKARENEDSSIITKGVDKYYPAFTMVFGEDISKEMLVGALEEIKNE